MNLAVELEDYLRDYGRGRFDWRTANCCHFASRWVLRVTGRDCMKGLQDTETQREARRRINELGGSLVAACTKMMNQQPLPAAFAQLGDVIHVAMTNNGAALGICTGKHAVLVGTSGNLTKVDMEHVDYAWRVGAAA